MLSGPYPSERSELAWIIISAELVLEGSIIILNVRFRMLLHPLSGRLTNKFNIFI